MAEEASYAQLQSATQNQRIPIMNKSFKDNLREAIIYRKQTNLPKVNAIVISVVIITLTCIICSFAAGREYHFLSEHGLITALSTMFLTMASAFSISTLVVHFREKSSHIWLWITIALGLGFLAMDESAQFHERLGLIIGDLFDSGIFRNWNDVIVILYGVVALPVVTVLLPRMMRYRMLLEAFAIAFIFYVLHTLIDSTQSPKTAFSVVFEESAKLMCGAFLALGTFFSFLGALWNFEQPNKSQTIHNK